MVNAKGHGQSECYECKRNGRYSLTWTSFLYKLNNDDGHYYCYECAKKIEKEGKKYYENND